MMDEDWVSWFNEEVYYINLTPVEGKTGVYSGEFKITKDMPDSRSYRPQNFYIMASGVKKFADYDPNDMENLSVINPGLPYVEPYITSYSMSGHSFVQGGTFTLDMAMNDGCDKINKLWVGVLNLDTIELSDVCFKLYRQEDGRFSGTAVIPPTMRAGHYALTGVMGFIENGNSGGAGIPDYLSAKIKSDKYENLAYFKGSNFTVSTVLTVSGTDNRTLLQGSSFNAMEGVTANNYFTGNITDKIVVIGGNLDTTVPGLYLIKYKISDTLQLDGVNYDLTYTDYRWIGVTEVLPVGDNLDTPLALSKDKMTVGASSSDVSIRKDGKNVGYSDTLTEPGVYTLSSGGTSASSVQGSIQTYDLSNASSVTAVIDKSGPTFQTVWLKNKGTGMIDVFLKPSDVSGTAEIRYMAGAQTLDACRGGGTVTDGKFSVSGYGNYTIYTKDGLGNEAVKVLNINKASYGTAYLEGVKLSAGALTKPFSSNTYSYNIMLSEKEGSVTITPVKLFDSEKLTINGKSVDNKTFALKNGKSATVKVKVKLGNSTKTYTFKITRANSSDTTLRSLSATAGAFDAAFDPSLRKYTLNLDKGVSKVKIKAYATVLSPRYLPRLQSIRLNRGSPRR